MSVLYWAIRALCRPAWASPMPRLQVRALRMAGPVWYVLGPYRLHKTRAIREGAAGLRPGTRLEA